MIATWFILAALFLVLAFCLTMAEEAFHRVRHGRVQELLEERRFGALSLEKVTQDSAAYLAVVAFLRVFTEAAAAVLVTVAFLDIFHSMVWAIITSIAAFGVISFVLVGVSPRTLGRQHAEKAALRFAPVVRRLRLFLGPIAQLLVLFGNAVTPGRGYSEGPFSSEADLRDMVDRASESDVIQDDEREMIHSIFELGDTVAREVMVPRPDMITLHESKNLRQARSLFLRSGFSRIPVIGESADEVLGILFFKDVVRRLNGAPDAESIPVTAVMREAVHVPESKQADDLLKDMQAQRLHIVVVIDEYGGVAGLLTIEDILEEIVGEITDEYDRNQHEVVDLGDGSVRVPASMSLDDLNEEFDTSIESEDVDTVGGLLGQVIGMVPILGSSGQTGGLELTAERMAGRRHRVATILVRRVPGTPDEDADGTDAKHSHEGASASSTQET